MVKSKPSNCLCSLYNVVKAANFFKIRRDNMAHLYIAICDDEKMYSDKTFEYINEHFGNKNIMFSIDIFTNATQIIESRRVYDFVFLDIQMGETSGIYAAKKLNERKNAPLIFFVTHFNYYLDKAMDQNPFRYLTKPLDKARLFDSLDVALKKWRQSKKKLIITESRLKEHFSIDISNILFIENKNRKTRIVTKSKDFFAVEGYKDLRLKLLLNEDFCETHQSFIVNLNYVTFYNKESIHLEYGFTRHEAFISRRKFNDFYTQFFKFAGDIK